MCRVVRQGLKPALHALTARYVVNSRAIKATSSPAGMARARAAIRERGGAIKANVFTRILLALYGECSWNDVPTVPPELILLPRWFPVHLSKMSYWARTVIVPLLVLCAQGILLFMISVFKFRVKL